MSFSTVRGELSYIGLGPRRKRKAKARKYQKQAEHVPFAAQTFPKHQGASRWRVRKEVGGVCKKTRARCPGDPYKTEP